MNDWCKYLRVNKQATPDEVKKSYRRLAKVLHPDNNPNSKEEFEKVNEAYTYYTTKILNNNVKKTNLFNKPLKCEPTIIYTSDYPDQSEIEIEVNIIEQVQEICDKCKGEGSSLKTIKRGSRDTQVLEICEECNGDKFTTKIIEQKEKVTVSLATDRVYKNKGNKDFIGFERGDIIIKKRLER